MLNDDFILRGLFDELLSSFVDLDKARQLPACKSVLRVGLVFVRMSTMQNELEVSIMFSNPFYFMLIILSALIGISVFYGT